MSRHARRPSIVLLVACVLGVLAGSIPSEPRAFAGGNTDPIEVSDAIPNAPRSRDLKTGEFEFDGDAIVTGKGDLRAPEGKVDSGSQINKVKTVRDCASVRMVFNKDRAGSLLGAVMNAAASVDGLYIQDDQGNQYQPIGYILSKDNVLTVSINPDAPVRSMKEFPTNGMRDQDKLFVYFRVAHGVKIVKIYAGKRHVEQVGLDVP